MKKFIVLALTLALGVYASSSFAVSKSVGDLGRMIHKTR